MTRKRRIYAADLFCGAGGTSTGLFESCAELGLEVELLAINHWDRAVETHAANHPRAKHLCATLDQVDPTKEVPRRKLDLLLAAPECTHHSIARGGRPMSDQSRASAWHVLHWAERLRVENILIENVRELLSWGPLGANGRPLKRRKGETFQAFVRALESLGYTVEWRILNCADHGDPTTRQRLFIKAVRGHRGRRPAWPVRTHAKADSPGLFDDGLEPWRAAREIIDWNIPGKSIFARKRPLAQTTIARIAEGLRRFGGPAAEPFLCLLRGTDPAHVRASAKSIDGPVPALTAGGQHVGLVEPCILGHRQFNESCVDSIDRPLRTLTASNGGDTALVEPFILPAQLDIRFRMLQPHELAAAMSFPAGYKFVGNRADVVRQIGNAVPVRTAAALCASSLRERMTA